MLKNFKLIFTLALRNVLRNKKRNLFVVLMIAGSYFLSSFFIALSDGTYNRIISAFTSAGIGHLQIHKKTYFENPAIYKLINFPEKVKKRIKKIKSAKVSYRLYSPALFFTEKEVVPGILIGFDPEKEVTNLCRGIVKGKFLKKHEREVLISESLAKTLNVSPGEMLAVVSQGLDGSIANELFKIKGIFKAPEIGPGKDAVCMDLQILRTFLNIPHGVHEIVVLFKSYKDVNKYLSFIKNKNFNNLEFLPWYKVAVEFYKGMQADRKGMWLSLFVVLFIISLGVLNTLLMAVLERTREFGLLKALGTPLSLLISMIYTEALLMLFAGLILGFLLAYPCNLLFSVVGISYPEAIKMGGIEIKKMYADLTFNSFFLPAFSLFIATLLVCIFPVFRVYKILPVEAMRKV